jgi:hypothetical protein
VLALREGRVHHGSCLCESIRYQIESDLKAVVHCHCRFCSKAHGAAFTTLLFAPFSSLTTTEGVEFLARYHVANLDADRYFCKRCGTRLYSHAPSKGMVSLVVATLNVDQPLRPLAHINTESKCSWFQITDGLPQFSSTPSPAEFKQLLSA